MVDALAVSDAADDLRLFLVELARNKDGDGLADDFLGGVFEDAFGGGVPAADNAVQVFGNNGIVGTIDDGGQAGAVVFGARGVGDVDVDAEHALGLAVGVEKDFAAGAHSADGAVRAADAEFGVQQAGALAFAVHTLDFG